MGCSLGSIFYAEYRFHKGKIALGCDLYISALSSNKMNNFSEYFYELGIIGRVREAAGS